MLDRHFFGVDRACCRHAVQVARRRTPRRPIMRKLGRPSGDLTLTVITLLHLHGRLHALEDHGILERHEVVECGPLKRILTEEGEYPSRADFLAAWEWNLLSWQVACLGNRRADPLNELPFRLDRKPWRNNEITDGPHWAAELTVDAHLLRGPRAGKGACVRDHVGMVD